ncbi:MAG: ABC transporter permease [Armatimonadota bacterium]|nr:ABC transporter permease [Armatimonadota bacterium]MDR7511030.1 ABC transporter permease [Armatimonadota bacterium]
MTATGRVAAHDEDAVLATRPRRRESRLRRLLVPTLAVLGMLAVWQAIVVGFRVPRFIAPSPLQVLEVLRTQHDLLLDNAWPTLLETLAGFAVGNVIAVLIAIGFVHNRVFRQSVYPLAVTLRTLPIVAISPIIVLMLGLGFTSKVAIAALITFFPTLVNMADGLDSVDPQALELMHVLSASRWEIFRYLRWPTSLPYLFSALRIATTAALLGAIIAEWIGSNRGLGYLILAATYDYRTPLLYATMAVASGLALALFGLVSLIERYAIPWRQTSGPSES